MTYSKYFPDESMMMIRDRFEAMDESKTSMLYTLGLKDPTMALILSIVAGGLGIDRFYIGDTGLGIAKLLTCGGCGIWTIIDYFLIMKVTKEKNSHVMTRQEAFTLLGVYILGMVWIILNNIYDISLVLCPTKILFGIPCPGCGMTRAVKLCLEGELLAAIRMNPNIILVWILLLIAPFILITQLATKQDYIARINAFLDKKVYLVIILIA